MKRSWFQSHIQIMNQLGFVRNFLWSNFSAECFAQPEEVWRTGSWLTMACFECESGLIPVYISRALWQPADSATANTRLSGRNLSPEASHSNKPYFGFQSKILNSVLLSKHLQSTSKNHWNQPAAISPSWTPRCTLDSQWGHPVLGIRKSAPALPRPSHYPSSVIQQR